MLMVDPYDPAIAFDDVYGTGVLSPAVERTTDDAARAILRKARRSQRPIPASSVDVLGYDHTPWSFAVYGDDGLTSAVRLDDSDSYASFRADRRKPYVEQLASRVSDLERALAEHLSDDHSRRLSELEDEFHAHAHDSHAHEVVGAIAEAVTKAERGGEHIPLPLPSWAEGKIECWRDGDEIVGTIRLLGPSGVMMATSAVPYGPYLDDVVGYADQADVGLDELLVVGPTLAQVIGASDLVARLCGNAQELVACGAGQPFVGVFVPPRKRKKRWFGGSYLHGIDTVISLGKSR